MREEFAAQVTLPGGQKVIPILEKAGLKVVAVQNPLDSLENDVAAPKRAIRDVEGPVVLVGHSWGASLSRKREATIRLNRWSTSPPTLQTLVSHWRARPHIKKFFAADLKPDEQDVVAATQGPFHVRTLSAQVSHATWRDKPSFMVVATKDAIIPPQMEKDQVKAANAKSIEVPSSHVAMLSQSTCRASCGRRFGRIH
jgi:pimeloyl-ACP methyl ester carboxylesterase